MENDIQDKEIKIAQKNTTAALENIAEGAMESITKNTISEIVDTLKEKMNQSLSELTDIAKAIADGGIGAANEINKTQKTNPLSNIAAIGAAIADNGIRNANEIEKIQKNLQQAVNGIIENRAIYNNTNAYVEDTFRETINLALNQTKNDILNDIPHKIVSEEELKDYLDRFDEAYQRVLDITLAKLTQSYNESKITQDVLTRVMIGAIAQSQEIALKMLGVDLQQENTLAQIRSMNQSIIDNRLIKCGDFIGNTIGYAAQGGGAFDSRLWTMLMMVGKEIMLSAGMGEEVRTLGDLNDIKKDSK